MFDLMKEPEPWYGFKFCEGIEKKSFLDVMDDITRGPDCMVRRVTPILFDLINEDRRLGLDYVRDLPFVNVGQFLLSAGSCQADSSVRVYGPFADLHAAFVYASENLGADYFYQFSDPDSCFHFDDTVSESV
jgi:hypothetical protein